jgi:hypothetical protein
MRASDQVELPVAIPADLVPAPPVPVAPSAPNRAAILRAFVASPEYAALTPDERELVWVEELLEALDSGAWGWSDLDLEMLEAILLDGLGWTVETPPEDPARVVRVLDAFLCFAGRAYAAPHVAACCAYLRSPDAAEDIARWLRPVDEPDERALMARLSAPYNWCDARCDRCPLAAGCPIVQSGPPAGGDRDEERAAALATAHALAAREAALQAVAASKPPPRAVASELRRLSRDYAMTVLAVRDSLTPEQLDSALGDLRTDAMLVAVKGSRVACHLSPEGSFDDEPALMDGVPNLLLLERIMTSIDARLAVLCSQGSPAGEYRAARDELRRALQPLLRAVPARFRDEIQLRTLTGAAPSPFGCL